jgi:AcrR family transcriptional regulator
MTRPRDANTTRNNILDAARSLFAQTGYDGTNLRQVAELAECNVALISRYFGGKDELFREVVLEGFTLEAIVTDDRDKLGEHLARYILNKRERGALEPLLALLRSSGNETATAIMQDLLETQFVQPLAAWLGGSKAELRAAMIASIVIGLATTRDILESPTLARHSLQDTVRAIAPVLQSLIDNSPAR